jgi:Polyketide cyclase / dehydrase and lipid transport
MGEFEVARSTRIAAPAQRVHGLIDDFHQWRSWSPWEDVDPDLRREYSGPESGVGARYAWEGNRKAGKGNMEIVDSTPERIELRLTFEKPWKATNAVVFTLAPAGDGATDVTWRMTGTQRGVAALFGKFVSMDRLIGKDFEKGLARMRSTAESGVTS